MDQDQIKRAEVNARQCLSAIQALMGAVLVKDSISAKEQRVRALFWARQIAKDLK